MTIHLGPFADPRNYSVVPGQNLNFRGREMGPYDPGDSFMDSLAQAGVVVGGLALGADQLGLLAGPAGAATDAPDIFATQAADDAAFGSAALGGTDALANLAGPIGAGLPVGDPSTGVLAPGDYNAGTSMTAGGASYGMDAGGGGGPFDWYNRLFGKPAPLSRGLGVLSGITGLYSASRAGKTPSPAPVYDPFAGQRAGYQQQLLRLSTDPNYLTQLPGYQAGLEATRRGMAAGGYNLSGNELTALQAYGGNIFNQEATRLAGLAGANIGPMVAGASPSNVSQAELVSRSLASLGYIARSFEPGD